MKRQKGVSLLGLILVSSLLIAVAILTIKVIPAVAEYLTVVKHLRAIVSSGETTSVAAVRRGYELRKAIDDTPSVAGNDLEIGKSGNDVVISVAYSKKIPLFANVSLLLEFDASSSGGAKSSRLGGV